MSLAIESQSTDKAAAEAFSEKVAGILDSGAVAAMMSIGHRLGLFDVMAGLPASTSEGIAARAELSERYVREWLAVMVTGGIVTYDPGPRTYRLPAEHAACLTRGAELGNLAVYAQHVALLGQMQGRLLSCFETGEGLAYGDYPCFHQVMAEDSEQTVVAQLVETILPLGEGLKQRLADGIEVLDAGCGRGLALMEMARHFPESRFTGFDLGADAIEFATDAARKAGLTNVSFEVRDLTGYDEKARFDLITSFDAIHDQKDPQALIRSMKDALKPGGVYLVQDIGGSAKLENNLDFPFAPLLYAISCAHCTPVSLGQGGLGLGTMWGWETAQAMLEGAGFRSVERTVLPHDPMNVWFVARV
ncbi:class I SAM-dependent methyltransferase [Chelativorans sp. AA-79]|uniref:class I SAM-dependent methyltransferase n=1 Tax=Chelativorans sp. AA-79 TaxID=3028735 RepID=UPI0023F976AD|nr:class I SAM-dependent methyltransferase [Chelativorans sp. AA-79]WEX09050.1 class I SAM-dependent methyltransferase [Chelativorans sp. AA-79]